MNVDSQTKSKSDQGPDHIKELWSNVYGRTLRHKQSNLEDSALEYELELFVEIADATRLPM